MGKTLECFASTDHPRLEYDKAKTFYPALSYSTSYNQVFTMHHNPISLRTHPSPTVHLAIRASYHCRIHATTLL